MGILPTGYDAINVPASRHGAPGLQSLAKLLLASCSSARGEAAVMARVAGS